MRIDIEGRLSGLQGGWEMLICTRCESRYKCKWQLGRRALHSHSEHFKQNAKRAVGVGVAKLPEYCYTDSTRLPRQYRFL